MAVRRRTPGLQPHQAAGEGTWILPGIFNPLVNLREHRYFGSPLKESARILFDFWANARRGEGPALRSYCQFGFFSDNELRTPMAAYHHVRDYSRHTRFPAHSTW